MLSMAFKLFKDKGYEATTYQDIADAVGTTRTIVQSYFPKKTRFTEEIYNEILELSFRAVLEQVSKDQDPIQTLAKTCQTFLSYLLMDEPMQRFTKTTLSVREGTAQNILTEIEWVESYCTDHLTDLESIKTAYIMSLGGTYEIIYRNLSNGIETDISRLTDYIVKTFFIIASPSDIALTGKLSFLDKDQLHKCFSFINRNLFGKK